MSEDPEFFDIPEVPEDAPPSPVNNDPLDPGNDANVVSLRMFLSSVPNAHLESDISLRRFLRCKKSVERAAELYIAYRDFKRTHDLEDLTLESVRQQMESLKMMVLPHVTDREGRALIHIRLRFHDPSRYSATDYLKLLWFTLERVTRMSPPAMTLLIPQRRRLPKRLHPLEQRRRSLKS